MPESVGFAEPLEPTTGVFEFTFAKQGRLGPKKKRCLNFRLRCTAAMNGEEGNETSFITKYLPSLGDEEKATRGRNMFKAFCEVHDVEPPPLRWLEPVKDEGFGDDEEDSVNADFAEWCTSFVGKIKFGKVGVETFMAKDGTEVERNTYPAFALLNSKPHMKWKVKYDESRGETSASSV